MEFEILRGRPIVPGRSKGLALVSTKPFSFLGDVDLKTGIIVNKSHDLFGKCVKGRIFCFPHGCGSTVGSYALYSLVKRGRGPAGIINETADPVVVVGAVIVNIPMVDRIEINRIVTGDKIEIDGFNGTVKILRKKQCT
jgi:predicted aconitase with swiveling domain